MPHFQVNGPVSSGGHPAFDTVPKSGPITAVILMEGEPAAAISATGGDFGAGASQASVLQASQQSLSAALASKGIKTVGRLVFLANGLVVNMDASQIDAVKALPGVKDVVPDQKLKLDTAHSVPFIGAPTAWQLGPGYTGQGIRIGIIDSGIDYTHRNFGGSGDVTRYNTQNAADISDIGYDGSKVVGGYDFVGNSWTSGLPLPAVVGTGIPQVPGGWDGSAYTVGDNDPIDCITNGHGSHVSGIAAGYGVDAGGNTYSGTYPPADFSTMIIGPGVAPQATLYALKIGACDSYVSFAAAMLAVDFAMDPNGDGNMSDHLDVTNNSYGGAYGTPAEVLEQAFDLASANGIVMVASAGNDEDSYFVNGDPGVAASAISVASSVSDTLYKGLRIDSGPAGAYPSYPTVIAANGSEGGALGTYGPYTLRLVGGVGNSQGCAVGDYAGFAGEAGLIIWDASPSGCGSGVRMTNAVNAGGVSGLVVVSANPTDFPFINLACTLSGGPSSLPCVSITATDGTILASNPAAFTVTFDDALTAALGVSLADELSGFSSRGPANDGGTGIITLKPDVTAPGDKIYSTRVGTGNQAVAMGGTSMASPHVTGMAALLRQLHPTWSVAQIKALVMNTATHNLWTDPSQSGDNYGVSRVGAGRIDIANAVHSSVIAYSTQSPEQVSVSFGLVEVVDTVSLSQTITVRNMGTTTQRYAISFEPMNTVSGTGFTVQPASIQIPGGATRTITVRLTANKASMVMPHLPDPTTPETQTGFFGELPRNWISEAGGYVVLDATTATPDLRVPVHAVVRPASDMAAQNPLTVGPTVTGSAPLPLAGNEIFTGVDVPYDIISTVSSFELVYENTTGPQNGDFTDGAVIHYVGITSDYPYWLQRTGNPATAAANTTVYFALATYGNWNEANGLDTWFDVGVDSNGDNAYDATVYAFDTGLANDGTGFLAPSGWTDTILSYVTDGGSYLLDGVNPVDAAFVNELPPDLIDTYIMDNNVIVLPVLASDLGLNGTNTNFQFDVKTLKYLYFADWIPATWFSYDIAHPTYGFTDLSGLRGGPYPGIPLWSDLDGSVIPVDYDLSALGAGPYPDILLLHHHNAGADNRPQVVSVNLSNNALIDVNKAVDNAEPNPGDTVTYTISVTNDGPVAASDLVLQDQLPAGLTYVSSTCPGVISTGAGAGGSTIITCDLTGLTFADGDTLTYTIVATVNAKAKGLYTNTVRLTGWNPALNILRPGGAGPDSASVDICVGGSCAPGGGSGGANINVFDPSLSKAGSLPAGGLGLPGESLTWTLTISNSGGAPGTNVTIVDNIQPELRIDRADIDQGAVQITGQQVTFFIPVLNPGQTIQAHVYTTVLSSPLAGRFENTATLQGQGPSGMATATASAVVEAAVHLPGTGYPPAETSHSNPERYLLWVVALGGLIVAGLLGTAVRRSLRRA